MSTYYYPDAQDALTAKKQFLREHGYKIPHCFQNKWGSGYVLFDSKEEVNKWYKEHTGHYFYREEYEPGTIFTKNDAIREIEDLYGSTINEALRTRDLSMPFLAVGFPFVFGNGLFIRFVKSTEERDIAYRFYLHYSPLILNADHNIQNHSLREEIISIFYKVFYHDRFKKRIEGTNRELARREAERKAAMAERERIEQEKLREEQQRQEGVRRTKKERQQEAEKHRLYNIALKNYYSERGAYNTEIRIYNDAMELKRHFTHGGKFPNSAGFICWILLFVLIFISMWLSELSGKLPYIAILVLDISLLWGGYKLILKKLKPYLTEEHFDEKRFQQWVSHHPDSPMIKYIRGKMPPSKPIPPTR